MSTDVQAPQASAPVMINPWPTFTDAAQSFDFSDPLADWRTWFDVPAECLSAALPDCLTVRVRIEQDDSHGSPWDEEDGHVPMEYHHGACPAGLVEVASDRYGCWAYDPIRANAKAVKEGWGIATDSQKYRELHQRAGLRTPSRFALAAAAVKEDARRMREYINGDWCYVGLIVKIISPAGELGSDSLWGIESDSGADYFAEVADNLLAEVLRAAKGATPAKVQALAPVCSWLASLEG